MQLDRNAKTGWLGRIYRASVATGAQTLLAALEAESDALQSRIARGQLAATSGNSFSATYSTLGPNTADLASLAGEMLSRYDWAVTVLGGTPTDAAIYAQMKTDMRVRPPGVGVHEVFGDYTLLRTGLPLLSGAGTGV